jgi:hypothetical protein
LKAVHQHTQKNATTSITVNASDKNDQKAIDNFGKALTLQNQLRRDPNRKGKKLHLRVSHEHPNILQVLSSAFLDKGSIITLNEQGLVSHQPHRQAFDGTTYFGCKKSVKNQLSGATGGPLET